jgi:hypothetical protein
MNYSRFSHKNITFNNKLYAIGGVANYTEEYFNGSIWTDAPLLSNSISEYSVSIYDNKLYVTVGVSNGFITNIVMNFVGTTWTTSVSLPVAVRFHTSAVL